MTDVGDKGVKFGRHFLQQGDMDVGENGVLLTVNGKRRIFSGSAQVGDKVKVISYNGRKYLISNRNRPLCYGTEAVLIPSNDRVYSLSAIYEECTSASYTPARFYYSDDLLTTKHVITSEPPHGSEWGHETYLLDTGSEYYAATPYSAGLLWKIPYDFSTVTLWKTGAPYAGWRLPAIVYFNGKFWTTQGVAWPNRTKVIYSSTDGITWTNEGDMPELLGDVSSCVYDDKWWILTSADGVTPLRKVYNTSDGVNWTLVSSLGLNKRLAMAHVIHNRMWVFVEGDTSAYYTTDGINYSSYAHGINWTYDKSTVWDPVSNYLWYGNNAGVQKLYIAPF